MERNITIVNMKRTPNEEMIFEITYIINFSYMGHSSRHVGTINLTKNEASFIPFENLTEEIVLEWVVDSIEDLDEITERHKKYIEEKVHSDNNPTFLNGTPWGSNTLPPLP